MDSNVNFTVLGRAKAISTPRQLTNFRPRLPTSLRELFGSSRVPRLRPDASACNAEYEAHLRNAETEVALEDEASEQALPSRQLAIGDEAQPFGQ